MLELGREKLQRGIHAIREPLISAESPYPFDGAGRPEKPFECEGVLPCGAADKYVAGAVHHQVPAVGTLSAAIEAELGLPPPAAKYRLAKTSVRISAMWELPRGGEFRGQMPSNGVDARSLCARKAS